MINPTKILVTGGTGFIGQAVVREALASGLCVGVLTRSPENLPVPDGVATIRGGLASPDWAAIEKFAPDVCIHCAWVATPGVYLNSPENFLLADQSISLAEGLGERGLQKFVGVGTCLEYESSDQALNEFSSRPRDLSPYVLAKLKLLDGLASMKAPRHAWLRVFYAYGPGEDQARFISYAVHNLAQGKPLNIHRPLDVVDYIHVNDVASAAIMVALRSTQGIYNVGSAVPRTIEQIANLIAGYCDQSNQITCRHQTQNLSRFADTGLLRDLGWMPNRNFEESVAAMCRHAKKLYLPSP